MTKFVVNEKKRIFRYGNIRIYSITDALKALGWIDVGYATEDDLLRGNIVHKGCEYVDVNDVDWDDLQRIEDEICQPIVVRVRAYELFIKETGFKAIRIEERLFNPDYSFTTKPDRFGVFPNGEQAIVEIKSGETIPAYTSLQTEAGALLCPEKGYIARYAIALPKSGSYKLRRFGDPNDRNTVMAVIVAHRWGVENGKYYTVTDKTNHGH